MLSEVENKTQNVVFRELMPEIPSTTYATFSLYNYPAKFIPQVIAYALTEYGNEGLSVIDPFAGYGTVGTVAKLYGNDYELWDLNPLINHIHPISTMKPTSLDTDKIVSNMKLHKNGFIPDWQNLHYWHDEVFQNLLYRSWGYYHSLENEDEKKLLLIPLIKTTRYFSYNDEKRQKLSRSPFSKKRIKELKTKDWEKVFFSMVLKNLNQVQDKLIEYESLRPKKVKSFVKGGMDSLGLEPEGKRDLLITSPPYLQAQEYIRATKMDLFWLGYSEEYIRKLGKKEFPYQEVERIPILSETYRKYLQKIDEPRMRELYNSYFYGVLGTLTRLQEHITKRLMLFVGPATIRTIPIPLGKIFTEHFLSLGWKHEETLIDKIVSRAMFFYEVNPATGKKDNRMETEHLVVLNRS